ncbi:MFS transporter [Saccharopolyspora spinosa]|uniref:MFS transporter n=1 Tax=Saccharopolyspora spinosa TaxID=60894 RepID=UPI000237B5D5|nr:MFS transporter [Saccharopolyspora spinosa]
MRNKWLPAAFLLTTAGWGANQFSSLLEGYQAELGLSGQAVTGLLVLYVVGLLPGLLLGGPMGDRYGRRPVVFGAIAISAAGTAALMAGVLATPWLLVGRLLAGISTGAVLAAGSAWVRDLSHPPFGTAVEDGVGARRAGVLLSLGFSVSGLVSALIAQWGPNPLVSAYLPHLVLCIAGLSLAVACPETRSREVQPGPQSSGLRDPRFLRLVVPVAPWVFVGPTVAFGVLPEQVASAVPGFELVFAGVAALMAPGFGAVVQPLARRVAQRGECAPAVVGLLTTTAAPRRAHVGGGRGVVGAAGAGAVRRSRARCRLRVLRDVLPDRGRPHRATVHFGQADRGVLVDGLPGLLHAVRGQPAGAVRHRPGGAGRDGRARAADVRGGVSPRPGRPRWSGTPQR